VSQPKVYPLSKDDPLGVLLIDKSQLVDLFIKAEKKADEQLMGIEYEFFGLLSDHQPLQFEGPISIQSFLSMLSGETLSKKDPLEPIIDQNYLVALVSKRMMIALEPGGQLEIASSPTRPLEFVIHSFLDQVKEIESAAMRHGISLMSLGFQPLATHEEMALVKKSRYDIMRNYSPKRGGRGLGMMGRSSATQVNIDYENEEDMAKKLKLAAILSPFIAALWNMGPFKEGKHSRFASERMLSWKETDHDRTILPRKVFENGFSYSDWIEHTLDVPMYCIRRQNRYINTSGESFRIFMAKGLFGEKATVRDFLEHMTTVFTDVRLKPYIEIRAADSMPLCYINSFFIFIWMIFYHKPCFIKAQQRLSQASYEGVIDLMMDVIRRGLRARFHGEPISIVILDLFQVVLEHVDDVYKEGRDDLMLLRPFLKASMSPGDLLRARFPYIDSKNFSELLQIASPLSSPLIQTSFNP